MYSMTLKIHHPMCRLLNKLGALQRISQPRSAVECKLRHAVPLRRCFNIAHMQSESTPANVDVMQHLASRTAEITKNRVSTIYLVNGVLKTYQDYSREQHHRVKHWYLLGFSLFGFGGKKDEAPEKEEDALIWEIKKAKYAEHKKEYRTALEQYHNALAILHDRQESGEMQPGEVLQAQVYIYDALANLSLAMGMLDKSEKLFKETLKGYLQMGNPKVSLAAVEISLKLSMIYAMQKRMEEADTGYNFCIQTMHNIINHRLEEKNNKEGGGMGQKDEQEELSAEELEAQHKNALALLGMCYNSYSRFLYITEKYKEAETMLRASLNLAKQSLGPQHPQMVTLHNDLGAVTAAQGQLDDALTHIDKAVELSRQYSAEDLPQMMYNAGNIRMQRKEYASARRHCSDALNMARKVKDEHLMKLAENCVADADKLEKGAT